MTTANQPTLFLVTLEDLNIATGQSLRLRHLLPELAKRTRVVLVGREGGVPKGLENFVSERVLLPVPPGAGTMSFFFGASGPARLMAVARALRALPSRDAILYADSVLLAWMMRTNARRMLAVEVNGIIAEEFRAKGHPAGMVAVPILRRWEKAGFGSADRIIAVGKGVADYVVEALEGRGEERKPKIEVIGNGIDPAMFQPGLDGAKIRREMKWGTAPVGIFVSGFRPWHGVENLLKALALVRARRADFRMALVGDGPTREAAQKLASELGLEDAVDFSGVVAQGKIPAWIAASDIGLCFPPAPASKHGFLFDPIKLYEYMAMGKPVVCASWPHLSDAMRDAKAGLFTEPSVEAFAAGILRLLGDADERRAMGTRGSELVRREFTWDVIGGKIAGLLGI